MAAEGTASPTPKPLSALPARIISTEEGMLAKPMRRKERKKMTPERMMEYFLPTQFSEMEERELPSIAPTGGRETVYKTS